VDDIVTGPDGIDRCWWCGDDPLYVAYHDAEWGRPLRDDRALYEKLSLEGFQSGLSWITILRKREAFRAAFAGFAIDAVAAFDEGDVERLLADPGIVRHRGKITAAIGNARAVQAIQAGGATLTEIIWSHAPAPRRGPLARGAEIPAQTPESVALAKELRQRGLRFVGPTTAYALMQSAGLVDDHLAGCHRVGGGGGPAG
jgi:DNA-3-methyladenine glycosylase I